MPVGIVAVGTLPLGLFALGCGGAVGGVAIGAGVTFGFFTAGAGAGAGFYARVVGFGFQVVPRRPYPGRPPPEAKVTLVTASELATLNEGWVEVDLRWPEEGPPTPSLDGEPLATEGAPSLPETSRSTKPAKAHAHVVWRTLPTDGSLPAGDYRAPAPHERQRVVTFLHPVPPAPAEGRGGWWWSFFWRFSLFALLGTVVGTRFVGPRLQVSTLARVVHTQWAATVLSAEGGGVAKGAACTLHGTFRGDGVSHVHAEAFLECDGQRVDSMSGVQGCDVNELPEDLTTRAFVYRFRCRDSTLDIDTFAPRHQVTVSRPARSKPKQEALHLVLQVAETSTPNGGDPLFLGHVRRDPGFDEVAYEAKVERSAGKVELPQGGPCTLTVTPVPLEQNCRVRVTCQGIADPLYGSGRSGMTRCQAKGRAFVSARDGETTSQDGDGAVEVDVPGRRLRVWDEGFDVTLSLGSQVPKAASSDAPAVDPPR